MMRPSVSMPELQYDHLLPGSKSSGRCDTASVASASVRLRLVYRSAKPGG